jgi:hypothetical protein
MAVSAMKCQGKGMTDKDKAARLAAALRENLRKRKAGAIKAAAPPTTGPGGDEQSS